MKIEKFALKDYAEVRAIWTTAGFNLGASDTREEIGKFQKRNNNSFLVGRDEKTGEIIAVCMGGFDGRRGYIHHLAVKPEFQKNGYGGEILNEVLQRLKSRGALKVHLFIEKRNTDVVGFYEKTGWSRRTDLILMSKNLDIKCYYETKTSQNSC